MTLPLSILALGLAILATAAGHVLFKWGALHESLLWRVAGVGMWGLAPIFSLLALRQLSVGEVYVATAITPVITTFAGLTLFREHVSRRTATGIAVVVFGVFLFGLGLW